MVNEMMANSARKDILNAALKSGKVGAHLAPSLSLVEIILAIYDSFKEDDSFILSKGHGALGVYAAWHQLGVISDEQFQSFEDNGGDFPGQPSRNENNGIEYSSGSLGMGLSYGVGVAHAKSHSGGNVYVVLGDGELNEGTVWESAALAKHLKLGNLIAIVDCNGMQSDGRCEDIVNTDIEKIWLAHGWQVVNCDGHSLQELADSMKKKVEDIPTVILAHTVKGRGISFMENNNEWHHNTLSEADYQKAVSELGE